MYSAVRQICEFHRFLSNKYNWPTWISLDRLGTGVGRRNYILFKWGYREMTACKCGEVVQTMDRLLRCRLLTKECIIWDLSATNDRAIESAHDASIWQPDAGRWTRYEEDECSNIITHRCVKPFWLFWWRYCYCYYLRWRMPPFMRQCWGLQVDPMHETAGMGKLINAVLLSLMRRVCVCMLCYPPPESTRWPCLCAGAIE